MLDRSPSLLRLAAISAAAVVLIYLVLQTTSQPVVSTWSTPNAPIAGQAQPIQGAAQAQGRGLGDGVTPFGNPLRDPTTVMTQGYGVGSHAPANIWGAIDLALAGGPQATQGAPIYATIAGIARVRPDTWPAGNYLSIENTTYKIAFAHLSRYAVSDGAQIEIGQLVGYVGATGEASGPHLHYEVWKNGVNVNPLDYNALDGITAK